ncbi:ACT domain-containing protein [Streptomyces dangxiongensis]|uniref:ACT domain-containing protein n=1 Tax=Streptomyces dangxiongensis TaxID=1442032 RepID=A0A3G2JKT3_9ACTN|nr:ACT domain-containing protein [Streptomyces dangxiongensis]AYN43066.1 ACT domain-containing protein [Streptomyces dangxiongensis]
MTPPRRKLLTLPALFRIEHVSGGARPADDDWYAVVRAPEGLTVLREVPLDAAGAHREVSPDASGAHEHWAGLYGDDPHDLDLPGMLAAVVGPLGSAGIPVFVTSTFHSDLVLVPADRYDDAVGVLRSAGHEVVPAA